MAERFFVEQPLAPGPVQLRGPEAHHLATVCRLRPGDRAVLFNGDGRQYPAAVTEVTRRDVTLDVLAVEAPQRELPFPLTVAAALPKGDRQKWLVEKLTELGVTELVPLITERGVAQPTPHAIERLGRTVVEASKQCGRNRLMKIREPQAWPKWIATALPNSPCHRLIAHPGGRSFAPIDLATPQATHLAVGPEGGLTDAETAAATASGWRIVDLGPRILRVETAAVVVAVIAVLPFGIADRAESA